MKPTATRARACDGKFRHGDERAAKRHLQRLIRRGASPDAIHVYPCTHGDHYHVGHRPRGRR